MLDVMIKSAPIFVTILIVLIYRRRKEVPENLSKSAAFLAFNVVVPFLIFDVLKGVTISGANLRLVLVALLTIPVFLVPAAIFTIITKPVNARKAPMLFTSLDFFTYSFGLPFILVNFTNDVVKSIILMDLIIFVAYLIIGFAISDYYSKDGSDGIKNLLMKSLILNPIFWALFAAFTLSQLNIELPDKFYQFTDFFSRSFPLLTAALIAANIKLPDRKSFRLVASNFGVRLFTGIIFATALVTIFDFNPTDSTALYLLFTLPIGSFGLVFSEQNKNDIEYNAQLHIFSYSLMLIIYPFIITMLKQAF